MTNALVASREPASREVAEAYGAKYAQEPAKQEELADFFLGGATFMVTGEGLRDHRARGGVRFEGDALGLALSARPAIGWGP